MSLICKKCGSNIPEGSNFCPECGAKFEADTEQKPKCAYCGAQLKATSKFCPKCGKTVCTAPIQPPQTAQTIQTEVPIAPMCAYCGREMKTTSKFCPHCGRTVSAPITETAPVTNAAPTAQSENISSMQEQAAQRGVKVSNDPEYMPPQATKDDPYCNRR